MKVTLKQKDKEIQELKKVRIKMFSPRPLSLVVSGSRCHELKIQGIFFTIFILLSILSGPSFSEKNVNKIGLPAFCGSQCDGHSQRC